MADPFAIIGIIDLGLRLSLEIYKFLNEVSDASSEVQAYLIELAHLEIVYKDVKLYCKDFQASFLSKEDGLRLDTLEIVLKSCQSDLQTMLLSAETSSSKMHSRGLTKLKAKLKWVTEEKARFEESSKLLANCKSTLQLVLTSSGMHNDIAIRDELSSVHGEVSDVRRQLSEVSILVQAISAGLSVSMTGTLSESATAHEITRIDLNSLQTGLRATHQHPASGSNTVGPIGIHRVSEASATRISSEKAASGDQTSQPQEDEKGPHGDDPVVPEPSMSAAIEKLQSLRMFHGGSSELPSGAGSREAVAYLFEKFSISAHGSKGLTTVGDLRPFLTQYGKMAETVAQYSPASTSAVWEPISRILVSQSSTFQVGDFLEEIGEQATWTQRELSLYKSDEIRRLGIKCHAEMLDIMVQIANLTSGSKARFTMAMKPTMMPDMMARFRRTCAALTREADFQHRVELMRMSDRLVDVQVDQKRMLEALEEQKRVLSSLEDQRKMMSIVADQQKILMKLNKLSQKLLTTSKDG